MSKDEVNSSHGLLAKAPVRTGGPRDWDKQRVWTGSS